MITKCNRDYHDTASLLFSCSLDFLSFFFFFIFKDCFWGFFYFLLLWAKGRGGGWGEGWAGLQMKLYHVHSFEPKVRGRGATYNWYSQVVHSLRISDQNGVSRPYIMLEIYHSGRKPLIGTALVRAKMYVYYWKESWCLLIEMTPNFGEKLERIWAVMEAAVRRIQMQEGSSSSSSSSSSFSPSLASSLSFLTLLFCDCWPISHNHG